MLVNRKQLAMIAETTPGSFNTAVRSATYAQYLTVEPSLDFEFQTYDRRIQRASLTPTPPLAGQQRGTCAFSHEIMGEASSGIPPWDLPLRACGYRRETLYKITIGAVTGGPFRHGETITQTTSGAKARVFRDTYTGTTTLYVFDVRGLPNNSAVWTGGTTGATATASTVQTAAGYGWAPCDFPTTLVLMSSSSNSIADGETATGGTSGARGVVEATHTYRLTVTSVSGTVAVGDVVTGGTSAAKGNVTVIVSSTVALVRMQTATLFSGTEALTYAGSGASSTHSSTTQAEMRIRLYTPTPFSGVETITFSGAATGTHVSSTIEDMPTLSFALYGDGTRKELAGARGNVRFTGSIGEPGFMQFSFTGAYSSIADTSNLSNPATPYQVPPVLLGVNLKLGTEGSTPSYVPRFQAFDIDTGHQLSYRQSMSAASGILETAIVGRQGTLSLDPEADLEAAYPFFANWANQTVESIDFTIGSSNGNKFLVQAPGVRPTGIREGNRDNIKTYDMSAALTGGRMSNASNATGERNDLLLAYITA